MAEAELTERQRYWFDHLKAAEDGGLTLLSYATEQGLKTKDLYNWKSRLIKRGMMTSSAKATDFVPVVLGSGAWCCVLLPNGVRVEIRARMSAQSIREVLVAASSLV